MVTSLVTSSRAPLFNSIKYYYLSISVPNLVMLCAKASVEILVLFYFTQFVYLSVCREQLSPVLKHTIMKSRISIEVDFENGNEPVIQILKSPSGIPDDLLDNDVRDKLISNFTQQLGGSSWCQIKWNGTVSGCDRIQIRAIPPEKLKEQAEIMLEQYKMNEAWHKQHKKDLAFGK